MNSHAGHVPVTVIIPCYRCTLTLERAVASVAAQSAVPAELILVDDCSGDGTRELMYRLAGKYASGWIRIVSLDQNMGAGSARNAAWRIATQFYIAFLDSDDAWHPEKVRIQLAYMQNNPEVALSGHAHKIISSTMLPVWELHGADGKVEGKGISKLDWLISNHFVTPSVMLRRDIFPRFLEGQRYMEDRMLWLNIVCAGLKVEKIALPLAAIYKSAYGDAGLSAQWLKMARGDLGNYRRLLVSKNINLLQFVGFTIFSGVKFLRRLVIYYLSASRGN